MVLSRFIQASRRSITRCVTSRNPPRNLVLDTCVAQKRSDTRLARFGPISPWGRTAQRSSRVQIQSCCSESHFALSGTYARPIHWTYSLNDRGELNEESDLA